MRKLLLAVLTVLSFQANAELPVPKPERLSDTANALSTEQKAIWVKKSADLEASQGFVVVAVIVKSLEGETIESFTQRVFDSWHPGIKGVDKAAIFVQSVGDRKIRIATSRVTGQYLTDTKANAILDKMKPSLKAKDVNEALHIYLAEASKYVGDMPQPVATTSAKDKEFDLLDWLFIACVGVGAVLILTRVHRTMRKTLIDTEREAADKLAAIHNHNMAEFYKRQRTARALHPQRPPEPARSRPAPVAWPASRQTETKRRDDDDSSSLVLGAVLGAVLSSSSDERRSSPSSSDSDSSSFSFSSSSDSSSSDGGGSSSDY